MLDHLHFGINMVVLFLYILQNLNIYDRILCITLDNAANNNKIVGTMHAHAKLQLTKIFHIKCIAHIINLVI